MPNWACRTGWVWVLTFLNLSQLTAQVSDQFIEELGLDEEETLPGEDLFIIESLQRRGGVLTPEDLHRLATLSFLSTGDVKLLRAWSDSSDCNRLYQQENLPSTLHLLLNEIRREPLSVPQPLFLRQRMTANKDVRYSWRGEWTLSSERLGFFIERDPGETRIADRASGYLSGGNRHNQWVIGDHELILGYGLLSWRSVSVNKGFESIKTIPRRGNGLRAYRSSDESWNLRGVGFQRKTTLGTGGFSLGNNHWDGYLDTTGIIHLNRTGIHTSEQKRQVLERSFIGFWEWEQEDNRLGLAFSTSQWHQDERRQSKKAVAVNFQYRIWNWSLFGEAARGYGSQSGYLTGARFHPRGFYYLICIRSYANPYYALRSNPFSEWSSQQRNERGIYQGVQWNWRKHQVTIYGDIYQAGEITENRLAPIRGQETGIRWQWHRRNLRLKLQWKQEEKTLEPPATFVDTQGTTSAKKDAWKGMIYQHFGDRYDWKGQVNISRMQLANQASIGYGVENLWSGKWPSWTITVDWIVTWVDRYESRVYFWDINLPGEMRSVAYAATGQSWGLRIQYRQRPALYWGLRIRSTWKDILFQAPSVVTGSLVLETVL